MRQRDGRLQVAAEVALLGVTGAAVVGMHRLFDDGSFRLPLLVQAVIAHGAVAGLRRARVRLLPAAVLVALLALISMTWLLYFDTTFAFLPTPDTFSAIRLDLIHGWQVFREVRAPAPVEPGFIAATTLVVWVTVFVADWGAFRTGVSFEALLPPATLFLFAAAVGADGDRVPAAALFVVLAMLFLLLHRTWRQEHTANWASFQAGRGRRALVASGSSLAVVAVLAGAFVGPNLPGADDAALLEWRDATRDDEPRVVVSPLVEIESRLVEQPDAELFTVRTEDGRPQYWRLSADDAFDGSSWGTSFDTESVDGELPLPSDQRSASSTSSTHTFTMQALDSEWLPSAFEPVAIDVGGSPVEYGEGPASLILPDGSSTFDGMTYTVTSRVPRWTKAELRTASDAVPPDIARRYLDLPPDLSDRVVAEAERLSRYATGPYDQAKAIEDYLRTFEYTLEVQPSPGDDPIEDFLFVNQKGFCQQFAGVFAVMARAIDIPSRVVVGFTPGDRVAGDRNVFQVRGEDAHAWVELWFDGFGWVTFDPTPGRVPPGSSEWLDLPEEDGSVGDDGGVSTTVPDGGTAPGEGPEDARPTGPLGNDEIETGSPSGDSATGNGSGPNPLLDAVGKVAWPVGLGALAYLLVVPAALVAQRQLRRRRARAPAEKVDLAWTETNEQLALAGLVLSPSLTVSERAERMRTALPTVVPSIDVLTTSIERVTYGEVEPTPAEATEVVTASATIAAAAARRRRRSLPRRVLAHFDARRLLTASGPSRTRHRTRFRPRPRPVARLTSPSR